MIVKIRASWGSRRLIIHDCPGVYNIIEFAWVDSKCTITRHGDNGPERTVVHNTKIPNTFIDFGTVNKTTWKFFHKNLGYVPLYIMKNNKLIYTPHTQYTSIEEIQALRKPIEFVKFMDYNIPKAIMNRMSVVCKMSEDLGESIHEVDFPPHLEPFVRNTLEWLSVCHENNCDFTIEQMAVCDFLGLTDIFGTENGFVFNGDTMLPYSRANLLAAGILDDNYKIVCFNPDIKDIEHNNPLLTDTIVETTEEYEKLWKYAKSGIRLRAMQLTLKRKGII